MYVVPVITGRGSLSLLISRLRESYPFFDSYCDFISFLIHDSCFQFFVSILIFIFTLHFAYRCLCSYSSRFSAYARGESRGGFFESILDFFFERSNDDDT